MSGFSNATDGDFDRVFMKGTELVDRFVGTKLWGCGYNTVGNLGDGTIIKKSIPVQTVAGGTNWQSVSAGDKALGAIKTDGTLWVWGGFANNYGQLGDNTTVNKSSPVQTTAGGTNWTQISCGVQHVAAIKSDSTLWTWGWNAYGQLGDNTSVNRSSPVQTVISGSNWAYVTCGYYHIAAIKTDGTLWSCGYNNKGQLGTNNTTSCSSPIQITTGGTNWKVVSGGFNFTMGIKTDGTLWGWGSDSYGQLGDNTRVNKSSPVQTAAGGTNWKQVACNYYHTAAIKTDGTLWLWGMNWYSEIGDSTTSAKSSPVQTAAGGTNWKQVSVGFGNTAAIKTDGSLWVWGSNAHGQLGTNNTTTYNIPVLQPSSNWKQVVCGGHFTMFAIGE
jgi:alpha-tubulin suppressor-like RCC1 family protein